MNGSRPTARTSGSASGSLSNASEPCDASARETATMVAVAPTLEPGPQLSPSSLVIRQWLLSLVQGPVDLEQVSTGQPVVFNGRKSVGREQVPYVVARQQPAVIG